MILIITNKHEVHCKKPNQANDLSPWSSSAATRLLSSATLAPSDCTVPRNSLLTFSTSFFTNSLTASDERSCTSTPSARGSDWRGQHTRSLRTKHKTHHTPSLCARGLVPARSLPCSDMSMQLAHAASIVCAVQGYTLYTCITMHH